VAEPPRLGRELLKGDGRAFLGDYEAGSGLVVYGPSHVEPIEVIQDHERRMVFQHKPGRNGGTSACSSDWERGAHT
jgi:hypothetical protein